MVELTKHERALGPLQVGLRRDLHVTRQETRTGPRYLVHDPITFQNHAFSATDYQILTAIVPGRTLSEVFDLLVDRGVIDRNDEQHFYEFVLWLHGIGLLHLPIAQADRLFERYQRKRAARYDAWYRVFLHCKIPLGNPDYFLQRTLGYVRWLFSTPGIVLWAALMAFVVWKCAGRFDDLFRQSASLLAIGNLPILWVALVALKAIHEFGHAYACRRFGGAVPEMGVVFIFLTPCAYVDASASWKFGSRWPRFAVALAGMYVESLIAGVFALVWAGTAPGLIHDVALNIVVLASVVTLFLNLNPLMKFDGYYLFSDLTGVFNLQERANHFLRSWLGHLALGLPRPASDGQTAGERLLYGLYGPSSTVYRVFLAFAITGLVMLQWPGAGLFLGAVFGWALMVQPVMRLFRYLWGSEEIEAVRTRARLVAIGVAAATFLILGTLPVSFSVIAPGVLDPRLRHSVRVPASGFVTEVLAENGAEVEPGDPLFVLRNPQLEMRRLRLLGELEAEETSLDAVELDDETQATAHRARLAYLRAGVEEIERRLDSLTMTAKVNGTIVSADHPDWDGRFLRQGEELFQIQADHRYLRVVLTDRDVSRARLEVGSNVEVRWTCDPQQPVRGTVRDIRRSASRTSIPAPLTMLAGGDVYTQPAGNDTTSMRADQPYLHVFLETDSVPLRAKGAGLTARVLMPARVEVLGSWLRRRILSFVNTWRMT